jgi:tetratricopeptide (TPR) repeat protein
MVACAVILSACSPQSRTVDPHAELSQAWASYRSGDFDTSLRAFERVRAATPKASADNLMALYGIGTTWDERRPGEKRELAVSFYRKIVELDPKCDLAAWSLFAIARMKHLPPVGERPDYPAVRAAYQEVIDRFPGHPAAEEAFLYQQSAWLATLDKNDAQTAKGALEKYLPAHPQTKYQSAVYGLLSVASRTLDHPAERIAFMIKAIESIEIDPMNPRRDKAGSYWIIASESEFCAGDFDTAREYYNKLIREYPNDQRVFPAQLALARMDGMEAKIRAEAAGGSATQ